jgi:site-specific DNA-methyltransferase (adenine-specific)
VHAKNTGKKGVLVLSLRQCSLGVTFEYCDVVLLLNDSDTNDMITQMMFRCMTESRGKKCGFVVDMDFRRAMDNLVQTAITIKPREHPIKSIQYLLQERIICINADEWLTELGNPPSALCIKASKLYKLYSKTSFVPLLDKLLDKLRLKKCLLSDKDSKLLEFLFTNKKVSKKEARELKDDELSRIKEGIEKTRVEREQDNESVRTTESEKKRRDFNIMEVIRHMIQVICLVTIRYEETSFEDMMAIIETNDELHGIFISQVQKMWSNKFDDRVFKKIIHVYINYMQEDQETNQIIRTLKELMRENMYNMRALSEIIDKYLIPQELEKKANAEVSTPRKLRQEMLDKIPKEFWGVTYTVFEPCSGKGGFLADIVSRFMEGLKEIFPDEKERYQFIVEECIYFADINPMNIFINKLLLDPEDKYNLKYYCGDTLELDIEEYWGLDGFDAVIGNPPYSTDPSKPDSKSIYNLFIQKYIDMCQYLLFVVPNRWFVGGKNLDKFRDFMMKRKDIVLINTEQDATKWFGKSVDIKGGVNYFLKDSEHNNECMFDGHIYELGKYDRIFYPKYHGLIDKTLSFAKITELYASSGYFKVRTNDKRLKNTGKVVCYVSIKKSSVRKKFVNSYVFTPEKRFWKVITARASYEGNSGFGIRIIGKPDEIYTDSYISFKVSSKEEAESLLSYLDTEFANYMLSIRKISQDISENTCKFIPLVPLDRIWTDKDVYEHFHLTKEEVALIENSSVKYDKTKTIDKSTPVFEETKTHTVTCEAVLPDSDETPIETEETLMKLTIPKLKDICRERKIKGYSGKNKASIVELILKHR